MQPSSCGQPPSPVESVSTMERLPAKTANDSCYTLRVPVYSSMTNDKGRIKPGVVLKLIDVAGCVPAKRHLGPSLDPVTASIDRMDFFSPVNPWEILILDSRMTRVWNTSMETRVVVTAWCFRTGVSRAIANAYMVTVAVKDNASAKALPHEIPALQPITPEDRLLMRSADVRKEYRQFERSRTRFIPIVDEEDAPVVAHQRMTPQDSNGLASNIFGGVILSQMYQTAQVCMEQFMGSEAFVCVRQERMDFLDPTRIGDLLETKAVISRTWKTSVEVQVECYAYPETVNEAQVSEYRRGPQQPRRVATTFFVFVGISDQCQPEAVPTWTPVSPRQQERARTADTRRRLREDEADFFSNSL